jgi:spore coat polysaccharide biosynthesis protein SpsF (cytidylyltransferase family)/aryl-alcohol dehydrogenase-like predicted oxidoreductase
MNIAFIQAREKSNRLPKKVLKKILDKTVLEHVVERVSRADLVDRVIVLTGSEKNNKGIKEVCLESNIDVFNGSDNDVLLRFVQALDYYEIPDSYNILRITADCPLIDPKIIDYSIINHINSNIMYSSTSLENQLPDGLDVEIIQAAFLREVDNLADDLIDREHVTHFIYSSKNYQVNNIHFNQDFPDIRLTLDYYEDYELITRIYEILGDNLLNFGLDEILMLYNSEPKLFEKNKKYIRNEGIEISKRDNEFVLKNLSKLVLGTANIGMNYGVMNKTGQVKLSELRKIIHLCRLNGINAIDTASSYGQAELTLGLLSNEIANFEISSKYSGLKSNEIIDIIGPMDELDITLMNLKRNSLHCYYLHNAKDLYNQSILEEMRKIKKSNKVIKIGISTYEFKDSIEALNIDLIDVIQIKYNILDFISYGNEFFELSKKEKKEIYVRSIFLQGVLISDIENLPAKFNSVKHYLMELDSIAIEFSMTRMEIILFFVFMNPHISRVLIGVDSVNQLHEIIDSIKNLRINELLYNRLLDTFSGLKMDLTNPLNW